MSTDRIPGKPWTEQWGGVTITFQSLDAGPLRLWIDREDALGSVPDVHIELMAFGGYRVSRRVPTGHMVPIPGTSRFKSYQSAKFAAVDFILSQVRAKMRILTSRGGRPR